MTTPTIPSDTELLRQARAGTAASFEALYLRHQGPLFRYCVLRCGSADSAADIVQEVFMGLLTGSLRFDPLRGALQNFLFGVARNLAMKQDRPLAAPDDEDMEPAGEDTEPLYRMLCDEQAADVRRALAQLAPHYRDVLILFEMHERSYLEIAAICGVDIGTVRSRLSRGRAALARRLGAHRPAMHTAA
jgi:RNA polymerase sigma-70 factor (ECF subfamily)